MSNLEEGASYYFRVMAENEFGTGPPCETTGAIKASEIPSGPGKLEVTGTTAKSISLSWSKPDSDGGSKITGRISIMPSFLSIDLMLYAIFQAT